MLLRIHLILGNELVLIFGSYRCATVKSVDQVAREMGNSAQMVKRHYEEAVYPADARKWFSIKPAGKVIEFAPKAIPTKSHQIREVS